MLYNTVLVTFWPLEELLTAVSRLRGFFQLNSSKPLTSTSDDGSWRAFLVGDLTITIGWRVRSALDGEPGVPKSRMGFNEQGQRGFSVVELVTVVAVCMTALAIAIPIFLPAYRSYQLSNAAAQVEMMLKYTRTEAIRLNMPINCDSKLLADGNYQIWTDSNNDGIAQTTEKQISLNPTANFTALAALPSTASIAASVGVAALTGIAPGSLPMAQFDQRGAVVNATGVYAVAISNPAIPAAGYRVVVLLPSGSTQIWSGSATGNWHQTN